MTPMTDTGLVDAIGPVAAEEFENAPDWAKPALREWITELPRLADEDFLAVAERAIYESASCSRFRGNFEHEHCKASACYHEAHRRLVVAGHSNDCRGPSLYSLAHSRVMSSHGYEPTEPGVCECALPAVDTPEEKA